MAVTHNCPKNGTFDATLFTNDVDFVFPVASPEAAIIIGKLKDYLVKSYRILTKISEAMIKTRIFVHRTILSFIEKLCSNEYEI